MPTVQMATVAVPMAPPDPTPLAPKAAARQWHRLPVFDNLIIISRGIVAARLSSHPEVT